MPPRPPSLDETARPGAEPDGAPPAAIPGPETAPPTGRRRPRRAVRWFAAGVATLTVAAGLLLSAPWSATGTRWLLSAVPGLSVEGVRGPLSGPFQVDRLRYALNVHQTLELDHLSWDAWTLSLRLWRLPRLRLERLALAGAAPPSATPTALPHRLVLPWTVRVDDVHIGRVDLPALGDAPLRNVRGALELSGRDDGEHRLDRLEARWTHWQLTADARLQAAAPLRLSAQASARPAPAPAPAPAAPASDPAPPLPADTRLDLRVDGPLARLRLDAQLRAAQQSLAAQAEVRLEDRMPLRQARLRAHALDLSALAPALPRTALSGALDATVSDPAPGGPGHAVALRVDLDNGDAGLWERGQRLPIRRLTLAASSDTDHPERGVLERLHLDLGGADRQAGSIEGRGRWVWHSAQRNDLALDLDLRDVEPARLSPQAPALRLGGPLALRRTREDPGAAATGTAVTDTPSGWPVAPGERWTLDTTLRGQTTPGATPPPSSSPSSARAASAGASLHLPAPVDVHLKATADALGLDVPHLRAQAGAARLQARLSLAAGPGPRPRSSPNPIPGSGQGATTVPRPAPWRTQAQLTLERFDPGLWWPAAGGRGTSDLNARLNVDLQAAPGRPGRSDARVGDGLWTALTGDAQLDLQPGRLWGVPVQGAVDLKRPDRSAAWQGVARLQADTRHHLQATLRTDPRGEDMQAEATLDSPGLQQLAPWWTALGLDTPPSGDVKLSAHAQRRGGLWSTQGRVDSAQLKWSPTDGFQALQGRWSLHEAAASPFEVQLQARSARIAGLELNALSVSGQGRTDQHRLEATTDAVWPEGPTPVRAALRAEGGWTHRGDQQAWRGRIEHLRIHDPRPGHEAWTLQLTPTPLRWERGRDRRVEVEVGATQLRLSDARLHLDTLQWSSATPSGPAAAEAPPRRLRAQARLEPLAVAPWLQRAQPDFGWAGDLSVSGRFDIDASPQRFQARAILQRDRGDLSVIDPTSRQAAQSLGLTELAFGLDATDGRWRLTQRVAGRHLGALRGEQTLQAPVAAWVPPDTAPVRGQIQLQMAELGHWGHWLPAGWRASGQIQGQAAVSGHLGAPEFSGLVQGQGLAVRNPLEGIDWSDARLRLALNGPRARLEQFSVQAGRGRVEAQGDVLLGADPSATLELRADRFAVLQRVDRRVVASGQAMLHLDRRRTELRGRLHADEGRFDFSRSDAPSLGDDVSIQRPGESGRRDATGSDPERPRRALNLDLTAHLGPQFHLTGRGLRTRLEGELRLTSPHNRLAVHGDIRAVDGTYAAYAQKLRLERGLIGFTGIPDNPRLDILALRPDLEDQQVGVSITGTAQNPRIRLYSEPSLTDTETLSWLILGRAPDGLGRTDLALLQRATFALLSGESDSPSLIERVGLDQLSVRQSEGDTRQTVVSVGKQISRRWFLGYERSLNAETGTWQLIYRLAKRFTLRAQSGADNALDVIWTWKWGTDQRAASAP